VEVGCSVLGGKCWGTAVASGPADALDHQRVGEIGIELALVKPRDGGEGLAL